MNRLLSKDEMQMTIRHILKCSMCQRDGLTIKMLAAIPERPEFYTYDPNHERCEPTLTRCPLSTLVL